LLFVTHLLHDLVAVFHSKRVMVHSKGLSQRVTCCALLLQHDCDLSSSSFRSLFYHLSKCLLTPRAKWKSETNWRKTPTRKQKSTLVIHIL